MNCMLGHIESCLVLLRDPSQKFSVAWSFGISLARNLATERYVSFVSTISTFWFSNFTCANLFRGFCIIFL